MKRLCILFIVLFLLYSVSLVLANDKKDSDMTFAESIKEIVSSINEIIKSSIKLAEAELKELQKELKERGGSIQKQAEKSIVHGLQKVLAELRKLDKALKKNLSEREGLSKEKLDQYLRNRDKLEERVGQFRKRIERFAEEIGKEAKETTEASSGSFLEAVARIQEINNQAKTVMEESEKAARDAVATPQISSNLKVVAVRALRNKGLEHFGELQIELVEKRKNKEISHSDAQYQVENFWMGALRRAVQEGDTEFGSLMAGQSVGLINKSCPLKEALSILVRDTDKELGKIRETLEKIGEVP